MTTVFNRKRLFAACSLGLVVTAMTFSIRANLMGTLGTAFDLSPREVGEVASAAFWGFTLSMFFGGVLCDMIGLGRMYLLAFIAHFAGIILTIFSQGYWSLFASTLMVGIANGFIESASYTMVSSLYKDDKAKRINDWHIWFPGGIVIGGVIAYLMDLMKLDWQVQVAVMLIPTLIYGYMFWGQRFPKSERVELGISNSRMAKACLSPLFLFMLFCMLLTAATELGTNQWIAELLANAGIPSILLLVFINGLMAVGRANAGFFLKRISPTGLLFFSAVFSCLGLLWMSYATGPSTFLAAGIFAIGICFFWPTMIGFVSEKLYTTGPLGLSLMGGFGLLSAALILPYMGEIYASKTASATILLARTGTAAEIQKAATLEAGAGTLRLVAILPGILICCFGFLHWYLKKPKKIKLAAVA